MSGLYIHIPFCAQACHYCDFHFSTNQSIREDMVKMIAREIELQSGYLQSKSIDTIYFGGGTPSILTPNETELLINTVYKTFVVSPKAEITLEANPDDLNSVKIHSLKSAGINRLSIGIQSFYEPHLKFLNRIHSSQEAIDSVREAQKAGIENITIDLIYGIEHPDHQIWKKDLQMALTLEVPHISSYCLTIEPTTVFGKWVKQKKMFPADDEFAAIQFEILMDTLEGAGYEHYEISNFAKPGWHSRHNSNYWLGAAYLGIGPSAHSYNGASRQFNISNNSLYLKELSMNKILFEKEELNDKEKVNEYLMTRIRTKWGCDLNEIRNSFRDLIEEKATHLEKQGLLIIEKKMVKLTRKGKLLADFITGELFVE